MDETPVLKVEQLTVNYDKTPVLWDLNFSIAKGLLVGIIGPNGAGKSTLLKSMIGMIEPLSGKVEFFGQPLKKVREQVAYVPQRSSVDWDFPITALDVVLMGRYRRFNRFKRPKVADRQAAKQALDMVGMLSLADRQIGQLSGGQQQRLFIARALVQDASIYLMDEPFAGVDMATEKAILDLLEQLKTQGKTVCIVHHDLNTVERTFDWVILLNTCLVASGPVAEVFKPDVLQRTYGQRTTLLDEAAKLAQHKTSGLI